MAGYRLRSLWSDYDCFLINSGWRTLVNIIGEIFILEYTLTAGLTDILDLTLIAPNTTLSCFSSGQTPDMLWGYSVDTTSVKSILHELIPG